MFSIPSFTSYQLYDFGLFCYSHHALGFWTVKQLLRVPTSLGCWENHLSYIFVKHIERCLAHCKWKILMPCACLHFREETQVPGCLYFWQIGYKSRVCIASSLSLVICKKNSHNSGWHFTYYYWFIIRFVTHELPNRRFMWQGMVEEKG